MSTIPIENFSRMNIVKSFDAQAVFIASMMIMNDPNALSPVAAGFAALPLSQVGERRAMKLYWSSRSPFVRKVMIIAHEVGVADRILCEQVRVTATEPHAEVMRHNPLGKIPTLLLDDGSSLYDSAVIAAYLDATFGGGLCPEQPMARIAAMRHEALGDGMMETLLSWLGEMSRKQGEQSDKRIAYARIKIAAALRLLEGGADKLSASSFTIGHAAIGSALAYMDFRFAGENWRDGHRRLADWHAQFSARPSVAATRFSDDLAAGAR